MISNWGAVLGVSGLMRSDTLVQLQGRQWQTQCYDSAAVGIACRHGAAQRADDVDHEKQAKSAAGLALGGLIGFADILQHFFRKTWPGIADRQHQRILNSTHLEPYPLR